MPAAGQVMTSEPGGCEIYLTHTLRLSCSGYPRISHRRLLTRMKRRSMPMCASPEPASSKVRRNCSSLSRSSARSSGWAAFAGSAERILAGIADDSIPGGVRAASQNYPVAATTCKKSVSTLPAKRPAEGRSAEWAVKPFRHGLVRGKRKHDVERRRRDARGARKRKRRHKLGLDFHRAALQVVLEHRSLVADLARDVAAARTMRRAEDVHAVRGGDGRGLGLHPDGK